MDPAQELAKLFRYLHKPFSQRILPQLLNKPSWTNWLARDFNTEHASLLNAWQTEFSPQQQQKAAAILAAFALDQLYDKNGLPTGIQFFRN